LRGGLFCRHSLSGNPGTELRATQESKRCGLLTSNRRYRRQHAQRRSTQPHWIGWHSSKSGRTPTGRSAGAGSGSAEIHRPASQVWAYVADYPTTPAGEPASPTCAHRRPVQPRRRHYPRGAPATGHDIPHQRHHPPGLHRSRRRPELGPLVRSDGSSQPEGRAGTVQATA
jgi:hypothetical protein